MRLMMMMRMMMMMMMMDCCPRHTADQLQSMLLSVLDHKQHPQCVDHAVQSRGMPHHVT